jgi:hypothetical protein
MAKHRARSTAKRALTVGAAIATACVLGAQSANAILIFPDNKTVSPTNSDTFAKCTLQVKSVDPSNSYATKIKLSGQAQGNNPNATVDNAFTEVDCWIMPAGDTNPADALAEIHPYAQSAFVQNTSTLVTLPFANSYTLCGRAFVKLVNGNTTYTPYVCS